MAFGTGISPSELGCRIWQNCLGELLDLFPQLHGAFGLLSYTPDPSADGIGTDGRTIFFPPAVLLRLYRDNPAAVRRGYLHMLLHCLYLHPFEDGSRLWNLAWDIAAEGMIEREQVPRLALPGNPVREACGSAGLSPAQIHDMLVRGEFPFSIEEMEAAFRFDSHSFWRAASRTGAGKKWSALSTGAGQGGRSSAGTSPGHRSEILQIPRRGMYDYRAFLRRFTEPREELLLDPDSFDPVFYTYGLEHGGNLPLIEPLETQEVNRLAELVIAIDTSGSCPAETVRRFLAETWEIVSRRENFFREMTVYLIQCDCLVQSVTVIRSPEDWLNSCGEITIQGRGGTDFTPVFRYVEDLRRKKALRNLRALLYFTDGDGIYPQQKPDYETAFVFPGKNNHTDRVPAWAVKLAADWQEEAQQ